MIAALLLLGVPLILIVGLVLIDKFSHTHVFDMDNPFVEQGMVCYRCRHKGCNTIMPDDSVLQLRSERVTEKFQQWKQNADQALLNQTREAREELNKGDTDLSKMDTVKSGQTNS